MNEINLETGKQKTIYATLSAVNVENFVKGKNGFKFLSWSHAVAQLLKYYPEASWHYREWDNRPYLFTEAGCFVEVTVTVGAITRTQLHPMLDFRNKPILKPDAFQVNTSLQRALAKAISLHGLGLYIYQGEDLPPTDHEAAREARNDLIHLLKAADKYNDAAHNAVMRMSYEQIQLKIEEYK